MSDTTGKIDLHLHTNKSDGRLLPTELVRLAYQGGVRRMALTDHDTTAGVVAAMPEAFEKWLAYGGPGDVPRDKLSPEDAIDLIHAVGGLAVVAHPHEGKGVFEILPGLAAHGLDGIETYYQGYSAERVANLV